MTHTRLNNQRHLIAISKRLILSILLMLFLPSCANRLVELSAMPSDIDLNGKWQFVSEDQATYEQFKYRAETWTNRVMAEIIARGQSRTAFEEAQPNRMMLDVLISLLSLPRKELFFRQTTELLEVDYGVAGYHSFPIGKATEMLLAGAEFKAIAGWQDQEVVVHILVTSEFDIFNRFRLMDDNNLLETIEIRLAEQQTLSHQRWYRKLEE